MKQDFILELLLCDDVGGQVKEVVFDEELVDLFGAKNLHQMFWRMAVE